MPTYRNGTDTNISHQLVTIPANGELITDKYLTNLPVGIVQHSVEPNVDPIIYSEKITSTKTVTLPLTLVDAYRIRVFVSAGDVELQVNDSGANKVYLGVGESIELQCQSRTIDNIIFTISSGTAYLRVTKA